MERPVHEALKSAIEVPQPPNPVLVRARQSVQVKQTASIRSPAASRFTTSSTVELASPTTPATPGSARHSVQTRSVPSAPPKTSRSRSHVDRSQSDAERSRSEDTKNRGMSFAQNALVDHNFLFKAIDSDGGGGAHLQNFIGVPIDQLIHNTPVFKECSYDFIETVLMHMKKGLYRPGNTIIEEGAKSPESMFFLLWGTAALSCLGERCQTISDGEAFGEAMALGIIDTWPSSIRAETPCMLCELSRAALEETLLEFPEEKQYFRKILEKHSQVREDAVDSWQVLRRIATFQRCSDEFLRDLDSHLDRRIFFPNQEILREDIEDGTLYLLELGSVNVEISGRLVWTEEIPHVRTKLIYGESILPPMVQSKVPKKPAPFGSNHSNHHSEADSDHADAAHHAHHAHHERAPSKEHPAEEDDWVDQHRYDDELSHEAAVFGEEGLLGISNHATKSVRATSTCDVRILFRSIFMLLLEQYPMDHRLIAPFLNCSPSDVFPIFSVRDRHPFVGCNCSQAFFNFLSKHIEERIVGPGRPILLDNFHKHVHNSVPDGNISFCRINRGRVSILKALPSARKSLAAGGRVSSFEEQIPAQISPLARNSMLEDPNEEPPDEEFQLGDGEFIPGDIFWRQKRVLALEICFLSVVHRGLVARALELLPTDREVMVPVLAQHGASKAKKKEARQNKVAKILRERSIFANTSQEFINEIIECGTTRVFMPGDRIIEQGTDGTSMFILWLGTSHVVTEQKEEDDGVPVRTLTNVGILPYGSVFGELVMLGVHQKRTASIIAATVCCTWEVQHNSCLAILERHPTERANFLKLVEEHLDRLAAPRIIYHPLFSGFHQQFRTLIGVNCERKLSFPGETVVREGTHGDKLYIMNLGTASLEIHHQHVMQVTGGSHFGFSVMTGALDKYPATVVAETMCQVLIISNSTYRHALHKYPEMNEMAKALEADEKTKQQRQRAIFARMVRRRRGLRCIIEALRGSGMTNNAEDTTDRALLEAAYQGWRCCMLRTAELRREEEEQREGNARRIERWLERRRVQMANIKPRNDLKRLVDYNLSKRGPLKLAKRPLAGMPSPRKPLSDSWEEIESPYLSPSPVWRRPAVPWRQSTRRLPPLSVTTGSTSAKAPWASCSPDASSRCGVVTAEPASPSERQNHLEEVPDRSTELPPMDGSISPAAIGTVSPEVVERGESPKRIPRPPSADSSESSAEGVEELREIHGPSHRQPRMSVLPDSVCFGMGSLPEHILSRHLVASSPDSPGSQSP